MPQVMLSCLQVLHHHACLGVMLASVYPCATDQALIMIWLHHAFAGNIAPYIKCYGMVTIRLEGFQSFFVLSPAIVAPGALVKTIRSGGVIIRIERLESVGD